VCNIQPIVCVFRRHGWRRHIKERAQGVQLVLEYVVPKVSDYQSNTWFSSLSDDDRNDYDSVLKRFRAKYAPVAISL